MKQLDLLWLCAFAYYDLTPVVAQPSQNNLVQLEDTYAYSPTLQTGIQYSPGWLQFTGAQAQGRHGQSISTTNVDAASVVLFFRGDSVSYVGDISNNYAYTYVSIDGGERQRAINSGSMAFQQVLWTGTNLVQGDHQIIITRDTQSSSLWTTLDYLQFMGPGAASVPEGAFLIDDGHSHVNYQGTWSAMHCSNQGKQRSTDRSFFFGGLEHTTTTPGDSLTFSFNGTAVWYFSDKRTQNGWVIISVDGSDGELVSTFLPSSDNRWFSQVLCWEKTGLSDDEHTVTITHSDSQGKYVSLDFFKYMPSSGSSARSSKFSRGAAVGVAIGGCALLIAALVGLIYQIRRSRGSRANENNDARSENPTDGATDKDATLTSQPATLGPRESYMSGPGEPGNLTDTTSPSRPEGAVHPNEDLCHNLTRNHRMAASDIVLWPSGGVAIIKILAFVHVNAIESVI
ncbi:hypothetical protein BDV93DRAFT_508917 [Ceratobasidium sp. AG-I]|nr:hypothetical protein BDV93DRAFT_508917 [Ceratobasidium sp. AG-I]